MSQNLLPKHLTIHPPTLSIASIFHFHINHFSIVSPLDILRRTLWNVIVVFYAEYYKTIDQMDDGVMDDRVFMRFDLRGVMWNAIYCNIPCHCLHRRPWYLKTCWYSNITLDVMWKGMWSIKNVSNLGKRTCNHDGPCHNTIVVRNLRFLELNFQARFLNSVGVFFVNVFKIWVNCSAPFWVKPVAFIYKVAHVISLYVREWFEKISNIFIFSVISRN